jgi:hypothetical protein
MGNSNQGILVSDLFRYLFDVVMEEKLSDGFDRQSFK